MTEKPVALPSSPTCQLCGEPMPAGEEMFNYHGYSGPCPKPPKPQLETMDWKEGLRRYGRHLTGCAAVGSMVDDKQKPCDCGFARYKVRL